jgi:hypothetical protein
MIPTASRVGAGCVPGRPGRAIRERVRVGGRCSGCRGVLSAFLLAASLVLAAPHPGAALLFQGADPFPILGLRSRRSVP